MHTGDRKGAGMRGERKALRRDSGAVPEAAVRQAHQPLSDKSKKYKSSRIYNKLKYRQTL